MKKHIKLAEIEIPQDIWTFSKEEREELVLTVKDFLESLVNNQISKTADKKYFMKKLLESSIIVNEKDQQYEICSVMKEIKDMIE
jgi:hypothetical protein